MAKSKKHQKHVKMTRTLYLLGYRDYFDGRSRDRHLFSVLTRKEQKAYLKGQKRALRALKKSVAEKLVHDYNLGSVLDNA